MEIMVVKYSKDKFMDLLLLGDEQESNIKKYLDRGYLFALYEDKDLKTAAVVTEEQKDVYEIKNIATYEKYRKKGYGTAMMKYIIDYYKRMCHYLQVGTGDIDKILNFYKKFGFKYSHTVKDFFTKNYDHEIFEDGKQLVDMIYLKIDFLKTR